MFTLEGVDCVQQVILELAERVSIIDSLNSLPPFLFPSNLFASVYRTFLYDSLNKMRLLKNNSSADGGNSYS